MNSNSQANNGRQPVTATSRAYRDELLARPVDAAQAKYHGVDYDALAARVQHTADALAQQDADYLADCQPDPTTEGDF